MADWLVANNMVLLLSRCWFSISIELWIWTYEPTEFIHNQYFKKKKRKRGEVFNPQTSWKSSVSYKYYIQHMII